MRDRFRHRVGRRRRGQSASNAPRLSCRARRAAPSATSSHRGNFVNEVGVNGVGNTSVANGMSDCVAATCTHGAFDFARLRQVTIVRTKSASGPFSDVVGRRCISTLFRSTDIVSSIDYVRKAPTSEFGIRGRCATLDDVETVPWHSAAFAGAPRISKRQAKRSSLALSWPCEAQHRRKSAVAAPQLDCADFSGRSLSASRNDARTTALRGRELRRSARRLMLLRIRL
jgi:hypothetical protein